MIKKLRHFFREYKQLGLVLVSVIAALALDLVGQDTVAHWILGISAAINLMPLVWGMIQDLRSGTYGVDILAATAIFTSVLMKEYWAGMIIVLMLTRGEALEDYAENRAKTELTALLNRKPKKAHVIKGTKTIDVKVSDVRINDKLSVLPGEVIPVDCVVIEGSSSIDESSLTGEPLPLEKTVGDELLSGSINTEGEITVRALRTEEDSQYEQIIKLVKAAGSSKSPFVRMADRYSIPFTITAFVIAGAAWFVSGESIRFLEVLVVATPCPLILGAPIALVSGMSRAAKHGIIVKTGSAIEQLANIQTVAFDKTGTLTRGTPIVQQVTTYGEFSKPQVLEYAAALEQSSNHILAKAIIEAATKQNIKLGKAKQVKELAGHGLSGRLHGKDILVGRLSLLKDQEVKLPSSLKQDAFKHTTTLVAIDGVLAAAITFTDEIRLESKSMLGKLKRLGVKHTLMVTGDNLPTAKAIAKELNITEVKADCLPADKILAVERVKDRPVAFAGDGVNDAPVLTASEVGIALGARGSTAASESADVVIMLDDIGKVADSIEIAKRTFFIARQSILLGIGLSVGLMFVFSTGKFKPVYGAAIQELVDVIVIFNALRAHGSFKAPKVRLASSKAKP